MGNPDLAPTRRRPTKPRPFSAHAAFCLAALVVSPASTAYALDGGQLRVNPRNGWRAFEVITIRDNPTDDGFDWSMPATFDGLGAWFPNPSTLRLQVNHETSDATISEVNLDLASFKTAIQNVIATDDTLGVSFVTSARQAYDRWSNDGGVTWVDTESVANTSFARFCSGQAYAANTFGSGRGFVDELYITGEEVSGGRLFALDLTNRDFYQVSDVAGSSGAGLGGMPRDAWENAALLDTGETDHVALLLSPDGGTEAMKIYVGEKGKGSDGAPSDDFLARNGLAYGSYYFLNDALPDSGVSADGVFDTTISGALISSKLEDVDTNPNDPTQMLLGDQDSGLFTFDFSLDFSAGAFDPDNSAFSITKVLDHTNDVDGQFGDADNVDWTAATTLGGVSYPNGLLLVNEDTGTNNGEIWVVEPDGANPVIIGDTAGVRGATESTGIIDISRMVDYRPGSILLTANQGALSSLTALVHPDATAIPEPTAATLLMIACVTPLALRRRRVSP